MKKTLSLLLLFLTLGYPQTLKSRLANGLTVVVSPREVKALVSITAIIKGGSNVEETAGAASLLGRLMPLGTKEHTKDEIAQILEDNLIDLQTQINPDYWAFSLFSPSSSLTQALYLLKEILFSPLLDEYEFDRERKKAISEIEEISSQPFIVAYARLRESLYGADHPYARLLNGSKESLGKLSLEELRSLHLAFFQPQNIFLAIVGDVEPTSAMELTSNVFGVLPKGERLSFVYPSYRPLVRPLTNVMEYPAPFAYLLIGLPLPGINQPDYPILDVINTLLGEGTSSRLAKALRWRRGISYDFGSLYPPLLGKSHIFLWSAVDPQRIEEAREAMMNELSSLDNVEEKELEKAKNKLIGDYILSISPIKEQSFRLAFFEAIGLGYQYIDEFPKLVRDVTIWDVKRVVRRYLKGNAALVLLMPSS